MKKPAIVWWIASVLAGVCVGLAVILVVTAPADLPAARLLAAVGIVLATMVLGLALAQALGVDSGKIHRAQRVGSLVAGALAGATTLACIPLVRSFIAPLGPTAEAMATVVFGVMGVLMLAVGAHGYLRR